MTAPAVEVFYRIIRQIPAGLVATYGQIASLSGFPRHARLVGHALRRLPAGDADVPWHRVVNSQGRISPRGMDGSDDLQRRLLESEGVQFDDAGRIDMRQRQWRPNAMRPEHARDAPPDFSSGPPGES